MRRAVLFFILLTLCAFVNAQSDGQVKIVRTDGTTMIGTLQSADGTAITIKIAGIEMTIPMSEVQSIEEYFPTPAQSTAPAATLSDKYGDYIITDNNPAYPDSFTVAVDGKEITMVLVRGGIFNMGYDDGLSQTMCSEPVHIVELSSYYISDIFVTQDMTKWEEAKSTVGRIAEELGTPYRMVTEAEWEFAAIGPVQDIIFKKTHKKNWMKSTEWCQDFWGKYTPQKQVNPTGPKDGKKHVERQYSEAYGKWWRFRKDKGYVRLAISADKIPTLNE